MAGKTELRKIESGFTSLIKDPLKRGGETLLLNRHLFSWLRDPVSAVTMNQLTLTLTDFLGSRISVSIEKQ